MHFYVFTKLCVSRNNPEFWRVSKLFFKHLFASVFYLQNIFEHDPYWRRLLQCNHFDGWAHSPVYEYSLPIQNLFIHFPIDELVSGFQLFTAINISVNVHLGVSSGTLGIAQIALQHPRTNLYSQGQRWSVPFVPCIRHLLVLFDYYIFTNLMGTKCYLLVTLKINFTWENEIQKGEGSECGYRENEMAHELVSVGNGWWVNGDSLSYSLNFSIYLKFSTIRKSSSRIQSFKKKEKKNDQRRRALIPVEDASRKGRAGGLPVMTGQKDAGRRPFKLC